MSRAVVIIQSDEDRERAAALAFRAEDKTQITFQPQQRGRDQNSRMWHLLTMLSVDLVWHGQRYSPAQWKDFFMQRYRGVVWMPEEDGGMVPVGRSTGELKAHEHREFIGLIEAFADRHRISLEEPA